MRGKECIPKHKGQNSFRAFGSGMKDTTAVSKVKDHCYLKIIEMLTFTGFLANALRYELLIVSCLNNKEPAALNINVM